MSKNEWKNWVSVVGRLLLAYALVFAQGAWAGQNQGTKDKSTSPQKAAVQQANEKQSAAATTAKEQSKQTQVEESESAVAEEKPSHDGSHEGIKVHGHWTIEVRNQDGSLARHVEFENSLAPSTGASLLANLLSSNGNAFTQPLAPFIWAVRLGPGGCQAIPNFPDGTPAGNSGTDCVIAQAGTVSTPISCGVLGSAPFVPAQACDLTTAVKSGGFVLVGSIQASTSFVVATVSTETIVPTSELCFALSLPCTTPAAPNQFTSRPLDGLNGDPQPVPVSAGQTISVTVNISFS